MGGWLATLVVLLSTAAGLLPVMTGATAVKSRLSCLQGHRMQICLEKMRFIFQRPTVLLHRAAIEGISHLRRWFPACGDRFSLVRAFASPLGFCSLHVRLDGGE